MVTNRLQATLWAATASLCVVTCRATEDDLLVVHLKDGTQTRPEWSRGASPRGLWVSSGTSHTHVVRFMPWEQVAHLEWPSVNGNSARTWHSPEPAFHEQRPVLPSNLTRGLTDAQRAQQLLGLQRTASRFTVAGQFVGRYLEVTLDPRDETGAAAPSAGTLHIVLRLRGQEVPLKTWTMEWQPKGKWHSNEEPQIVRLSCPLLAAPARHGAKYMICVELQCPGARPLWSAASVPR